jgi:hypothetical protein
MGGGGRWLARCLLVGAMAVLMGPTPLVAQWIRADLPGAGFPNSAVVRSPEATHRSFSWPTFAAGVATSLLAHEAAHFTASILVGATPGLRFDSWRPVVESGIDEVRHPAKQFVFSSGGMTVQLLLNEILLDVPHGRGPAGEFARGILAGGVGTVLFYFTAGRSSQIGDVWHMAQTSGLSTWTLTAIFGGVAATQVVRIVLRDRYTPFFAFPGPAGELNVGVRFRH